MPIEIAPNRIELSDLTGGFTPDPLEAAVPMSATPDVLNLLPRPFTNELYVRYGFNRVPNGRATDVTGTHWIRHVWYYETILSFDRLRYLVCVLSNGEDGTSDNVQIWVYDFNANTFSRVDTPGRSWTRGNRPHWGAVIEGTFYGGTVGDKIYSWHPTFGWDATPADPSSDTWVDSTSPGAGEVARNYAFKKGAVVKIGSSFYKAAKSIRFKTWESGQRYQRGEKVSRKASEGGETYWRSFECIKSHTAGTDADQPGTGANTGTYWKRVRLQAPKDEDDNLTTDWFYQPAAGKGEVGAYHANRLFVRHDDNDNFARLQYSAPARPERDALIADLDFDATDWAAVDDNEGTGGGWENIPFSGKGDAIRALHSFGNYLLIYGRWQSYVISGLNPNTWTVRKLGEHGAISHTSVTEVGGLVYALDRHGVLSVTDGTNIQPVAGMEKIRQWLKTELDRIVGDEDFNWFPQIIGYEDFVFIALPDGTGVSGGQTLVYDTRTASWWLLDIPMLAMAVGETQGVHRMWFSTSIVGDTGETPTIFKYRDDPGNELYTDDDYQALDGTTGEADILWSYQTAWFQFGMVHSERRVRRLWALVSGETGDVLTVDTVYDFVPSTVETRDNTLAGTAQAEFIEGSVGQSGHTVHAVGMFISGESNARTALHGVGVDTEPVRFARYHREA